jgi:hypothetical protein
MKTVFAAIVMVSLAACATEGATDDGPCTEEASMCATVHVPSDFTSSPRQVIVGLYSELPPTSPPFDVPLIVDMPSIDIDQPIDIMALDMETAGEYFVYVALYNEGGGQFVPEPGIDYVWESTAAVDVGSGAVNLGDIMVELLED